MFGSQQYSEGKFKPERGGGNNWHVWCMTGALQVLDTKEYEQWLEKNPGQFYSINFANGSAARISPAHPLWKKLVEIAKNYTVRVFPLRWETKYVPWSGDADSISAFDAFGIEEAN